MRFFDPGSAFLRTAQSDATVAQLKTNSGAILTQVAEAQLDQDDADSRDHVSDVLHAQSEGSWS